MSGPARVGQWACCCEVIKACAVAGARDEALAALTILLAKPGGRFIAPVMIDPYLAEVRKLPGFEQLGTLGSE